MSFFSRIFGRRQSPTEAVKETLYAFGLNDYHIQQATREIVELKDAALDGSKKNKLVVEFITDSHMDAVSFGDAGGTKWPDTALNWLTQIVQLIYLLAKLTGRI